MRINWPASILLIFNELTLKLNHIQVMYMAPDHVLILDNQYVVVLLSLLFLLMRKFAKKCQNSS